MAVTQADKVIDWLKQKEYKPMAMRIVNSAMPFGITGFYAVFNFKKECLLVGFAIDIRKYITRGEKSRHLRDFEAEFLFYREVTKEELLDKQIKEDLQVELVLQCSPKISNNATKLAGKSSKIVVKGLTTSEKLRILDQYVVMCQVITALNKHRITLREKVLEIVRDMGGDFKCDAYSITPQAKADSYVFPPEIAALEQQLKDAKTRCIEEGTAIKKERTFSPYVSLKSGVGNEAAQNSLRTRIQDCISLIYKQ